MEMKSRMLLDLLSADLEAHKSAIIQLVDLVTDVG